jgi:thiamine-phosphate pyrophosphorylase
LLLYYITDRAELGHTESDRRRRLLQTIEEAVACGIDFIQLREKDLPIRELEILATQAEQIVRESRGGSTRLLVNSRVDVAIAAQAQGVHLRSNDISPLDARAAWRKVDGKQLPVIAVSCHTEAEVARAADSGADLVVFGPVFEKKNTADIVPRGLDRLHSACAFKIPVLAIGGVTHENAALCVNAGAAGVAGIRLFQDRDMTDTVTRLRESVRDS